MDEGFYFPLDVFLDILLLLPVSARRRFRLVCRFWREVIDTRTTEMQSRPRTLAFVGDTDGTMVSAYIVDDLSEGRARKLWTGRNTGKDGRYPDVNMVGTCNGLICLCDRSKPGEITIVNPFTGETLPVPPLSGVGQRGPYVTTRNYEAYSFAYHPTTGTYKILHVPCFYICPTEIDAVYALTLGEASWRAVPTPGASCNLYNGLVNIDGMMFWVACSGTEIMSLDLEAERLTSTIPMPPVLKGGFPHLVEVHGRLGIATNIASCVKNTEVWVLQDEGWSRRYSVYVHYPHVWQSLAQPQFAQHGYILMREWTFHCWILYIHRPTEKLLESGVVYISKKDRGTNVDGIRGSVSRIFSYVETTEPLSCYVQESTMSM